MFNFRDLLIKDIELLSEIPKITSLRSHALSKNVTPAHLSKTLKKLESSIGTELIIRSNIGVKPTFEAIQIAKKAQEALIKLNEISKESLSSDEEQFEKQLVIGTRSFLNTAFTPAILEAFEYNSLNYEIKFIDLSPNDVREAIRLGDIDIALTIEKTGFGDQWISKKIGALPWGIYARKGHPLEGKKPSFEQISKFRFTRANYWDGTKVVNIGDKIPIPKKYKRYGHGVQTTQTAIATATSTDMLIYIPEISAKRDLSLGEITKLKTPGVKEVKDEVYIHAHQDNVSQKVFDILINTLRDYIT